jgi:hypothetical protein
MRTRIDRLVDRSLGVVYEGWDPDLERTVALKVRPVKSPRAPERAPNSVPTVPFVDPRRP